MNFLEWLGFKKVMEDTDPSNIVKFPKPKEVPKIPYVEPPKPAEDPATVFYRIGVTDKNRLAFQMGYSEITMNKEGVENLIRQLEVFKDQLASENSESQ